MERVYYEKSCELDKLTGKTSLSLGYGSQGHPHDMTLMASERDQKLTKQPKVSKIRRLKESQVLDVSLFFFVRVAFTELVEGFMLVELHKFLSVFAV